MERQDPVWSWRFRLLESEALLWKSIYPDAYQLLVEAPPGNFPSDIMARRKILQGRALCRLGKPAESFAALNEAEHLIKASERDLQAELAFAHGRCTSTEDPETARAYYQQSANLAHGVDEFLEARGLLDVGYLFLQERSFFGYRKAIDTLDKALPIGDSSLLKEKTLGNLGECYAELGDWAQSIARAEQAEKLAAQIGKDAEGDREKWLIDLGRAHFALAEFSQAEEYYRQALTIGRNRNDQAAVSKCLNDLTQLALRRHDLHAAEQYWKEEAAMSLSAQSLAYVSFDEAGIAAEQHDFSRAERLFKEILKSKPRDSLRLTTERELGIAYWHENKSAEADRTFRDAIADAEAVIAQLPPQYRMSFQDEDTFYDSYVRFLVAQDRKLDALKIAERGRAQILSQALSDAQGRRSVFNLTALQAALKKRKQIVLAYSLTNEESFLWVITPEQLQLFELPSHKAIWSQIETYNQIVVDRPRGIEDSAGLQDLYKTLVQPAENLIPKGSRVVVIPSKILSPINFEALIVPGDHPHYWIEDVEVETASSLALLAHSASTDLNPARKKDLLLLGAPIPPPDSSLPVLKYATEEINRVRSHFEGKQETIISGKDAVSQAYRASQPGQYRFIHIDAHSIPSDLSPLDSYIVLSPAADNSYKLFAHEIEGVPLHADLVTISACYSAGTRVYQGEGIVGLGWAFLRAGAHQVMASLWAVDDASTPQLMDDFYGELTHGKSAAEALHDAKLKMLHSGSQHSQPYYWASLQLYTGS